MAYLAPAEFVTKMVDAGESKLLMSTRDTLIRSYMAGAILALAAAFAVTVSVNTGNPLIGALLFPVGFCLLYLMGFDLLTGVFTLGLHGGNRVHGMGFAQRGGGHFGEADAADMAFAQIGRASCRERVLWYV